MGLIFIASSIPDVQALPGGVSDKTAHFWVYGVLGLLTYRALAADTLAGLTIPRAVLSVLIALAYGISDEFHQSFVPGRSPDVFDVIADTAGAAGAVLVLLVAGYWLRRRRPTSR